MWSEAVIATAAMAVVLHLRNRRVPKYRVVEPKPAPAESPKPNQSMAERYQDGLFSTVDVVTGFKYRNEEEPCQP